MPLIAVSILIGGATYYQARQLIEAETLEMENRILATKRQEIQHYISLALTSIERLYKEEPGGRAAAQAEAKRILNNMTFGADGYFFVYKLDGTNIVHPKIRAFVDYMLNFVQTYYDL